MRNRAQRKADEDGLKKLVEEQKREKDAALKKVLELERNLDEMTNQMNERLKEKKEELDDLKDLNQQLLTKERQANDELQEARKGLMEGLIGMQNKHVHIGIKRMGEIDEKSFKCACDKIFPPGEADIQAHKLCNLWQMKLKNSEWQPFRIVEDGRGNAQHVLNRDDELLTQLRADWGDEAYDAVVTAFMEIQEYDTSGSYVVSEMWNFEENRKATMKEVISDIFNQLKTRKRKRT